jgi:gluconolactonase
MQRIAERRRFLAGALVATAWAATGAASRAQTIPGGSTTPRSYGPHADPVRYPEPDVLVLDKRFAGIKVGNSPSNASTPVCSGPRARSGTTS